jgi:hypothetical protein
MTNRRIFIDQISLDDLDQSKIAIDSDWLVIIMSEISDSVWRSVGQVSGVEKVFAKMKASQERRGILLDRMDVVEVGNVNHSKKTHTCSILSVAYTTNLSRGVVHFMVDYNAAKTTPWQALAEKIMSLSFDQYAMFQDLYKYAVKKANATRKEPLTEDDWNRDGLSLMCHESRDSYFNAIVLNVNMYDAK